MNRRVNEAGYTVSEVITAVAISIAVAGTAAPMASVILRQHQMVATSRRLGFEIARARMQAVGQNRFVRITVVGTSQYKREYSDDGVSFVSDGPTTTLPVGFTLAAGSTGTPRFDRQGLAAASTSITVTGPRGQQTVNTSVLGRVTTS
jgi:Tfp pilus assembly protein FimT